MLPQRGTAGARMCASGVYGRTDSSVRDEPGLMLPKQPASVHTSR